MVVPSMAHTSSPPQRTGPAVTAVAGPRSRSNSHRSGAAPSRARACHNALSPGLATGRLAQPSDQLVPHLPVTHLSEQAPSQQVDHHPRRQHPDPGLRRASGRQRLIDHLKRHDLGELAR